MTPCPVKATSHEPHEILLPWLHSDLAFSHMHAALPLSVSPG